jgi:alkyl hydroperoxide reductase subunit AhpF
LSAAGFAQELVIPASSAGQKILSDGQVASVRAWWSKTLTAPVRVQLYVDGAGCNACEVTARVLQQLQGASPNLAVNVALAGSGRTAEEPLERLPEVRVFTRTGNVIRFFGTQVGVEVTSLVQTIADASLGQSPLPPDLTRRARELPKGSRLRVFVGSACTHCPGAVRAAVAVALASPMLRVDVLSTADFPDLARRFRVSAVPTTAVNDRAFFAEPRTPAQVLEALLASAPQ